MALREYECSKDGFFEVRRPISAPTTEDCPKCGKAAERIYTCAPSMGITGNGIPDGAKDMSEYESWQRERWSWAESECSVDNMGAEDVSSAKIVPQHKFGNDV